ncbi:MAG TPA: hypothetical protein VGE35_01370 [Candidatus Paceibacterota bacterium]
MHKHSRGYKIALISFGAAFLITAIAVSATAQMNSKNEPITGITQPGNTTTGACYVGGCSAEICSDQPDMVSNCMYRPQFACYKSTGAKCERQSTGNCGWTETEALAMCIKNADAETMGVEMPQ